MATGDDIRADVRRMFDRVAATPGGKYPFPVGPDLARAVGYPKEVLASLPASAWEAFTGRAYLHKYLRLGPGERVLDLGSGGGMDAVIAARAVGPNGSVIGLDFSETMVERAQRLAKTLDADNVRFERGEAESTPFADGTFDVAYANGLLNVCHDKAPVVSELRRVLKPGGRAVIAEITCAKPPPTDSQSVNDDWFKSLSRALPEAALLALFREGGFSPVKVLDQTVDDALSKAAGTHVVVVVIGAERSR